MYKRVFRFVLKLEIGRGEVEMGRRSPQVITEDVKHCFDFTLFEWCLSLVQHYLANCRQNFYVTATFFE